MVDSKFTPRRTAIALATLTLLGASGCGEGDGTTTTPTTTAGVSGATGPAEPLAGGDAFIRDLTGQEFSEPEEFRFSVNGDLIGSGLSWTGWGEDEAEGTGELRFVDSQTEPPATLPGVVTLSALAACDGRNYYTHAEVDADNPPFEPNPLDYPTPCE